jgi:hypothetical protein
MYQDLAVTPPAFNGSVANIIATPNLTVAANFNTGETNVGLELTISANTLPQGTTCYILAECTGDTPT